MTIPQLAAELAALVPAMAQDSAENNAQVIQSKLDALVADLQRRNQQLEDALALRCSPIRGDDMLMSALHAINGPGSTTERSMFVIELFRRLKANEGKK